MIAQKDNFKKKVICFKSSNCWENLPASIMHNVEERLVEILTFEGWEHISKNKLCLWWATLSVPPPVSPPQEAEAHSTKGLRESYTV